MRIFSKMTYALAIASLVVTSAINASAAVPSNHKTLNKSILSAGKASFGGVAGSGFTLLDVRRSMDVKKGIERFVFDIGDREGNKIAGWPGFYHAELKKNPGRLVLNFAQMPNSQLSQKEIQSRLKGSLAVKNAAMSLEPVDNTLNITFDLKGQNRAHVYQVMGKKSTSKVVVDLLVN